MKTKKHQIVLVEDEIRYVEPLLALLDSHPKFEVAAVTDSSVKGWDLVREKKPEIIILDLQLAGGHGFDLLKKVRLEGDELPFQPHILVVTSFSANITQQKIREFADFVIIKGTNYKADDVVSYLEFMEDEFGQSTSYSPPQPIKSDIPTIAVNIPDVDSDSILRARIEQELNEYAIKHSMKGRKFLAEAIYLTVKRPADQSLTISDLYEELAKNFGKTANAINSAIKRTLSIAFKNTEKKQLLKVYTPLTNRTLSNIPGNKEFIIYTANKIKSESN